MAIDNGNNSNVPKKPLITITPSTDQVILALEERGFAVGLMADGTTIKKEARNIEDFLDLEKKASVTWIDYVVDNVKKEAPKIAKSLGFSEALLSPLLKNDRSSYEDLNNELGIEVPAIVVNNFDVQLKRLIILIRGNLVVTMHTTEVRRFFRLRRYADIFLKKIKSNAKQVDKLAVILIRILDENNSRNFEHLREIEEAADKVSAQLADSKVNRDTIGPQIHHMKHAIVTYLNGLWATADVFNSLRYGDAELLTDDLKLLAKLDIIAKEVQSHISLAEHLSDVLIGGLEVMQSIYNNQLQILNNKMAMLVAYLTILGTAVLVPNTLATALSSSVFALTPVDRDWYIELLLVSTIVSTLLAFWWVKRNGLLPRKPHEE
ncbi:MAG: CorA family divalent cation transporter [Candidatus Micrarchaeota archaeon]